MKRIINGLLSFFKYIFLVGAFGITFFITLKANARLDRNITSSLGDFIPYAVLVLLFILNIALNRKAVTKNLFYNISAVVVFSTNIIICLRAMFDKGMLFHMIQGVDVNFVYFNDSMPFIRLMFYGLVIANIVLMFIPNSYVEGRMLSKRQKNENRKKKLKELYNNETKPKAPVSKKIEIDDEII